jgi:hypothetical protein
MSQTTRLGHRLCRCQLAPEGLRLNVVSADPLAVDLDDRDQFAVTLLELRVAVDGDLSELETELVAELGELCLGPLAEVAARSLVKDNPRVTGRGHAL